MDVSKMNKYHAPVHFSSFPHLTITLCGIGLLLIAYFTVAQVTATKASRSLVKDVTVATLASFFLGFGSLFLLLWVGIYV
ncbi:unnamed protein product [Caenorhabditis angaria]|uniref:Dolichyl-diphosphooligosaccharide-protein glycosyltransferase subunit TMEM258 n=1 Tax=Caenorhabditis angaria TaxID=860376 RepID=A0A9P1IUW7_9PELO|nr:unnamed protein product [Caenorhabditis angaria]